MEKGDLCFCTYNGKTYAVKVVEVHDDGVVVDFVARRNGRGRLPSRKKVDISTITETTRSG